MDQTAGMAEIAGVVVVVVEFIQLCGHKTK